MLPKHKATLICIHYGKYFSPLVYLEYNNFLSASSYIKQIVTPFISEVRYVFSFQQGQGFFSSTACNVGSETESDFVS